MNKSIIKNKQKKNNKIMVTCVPMIDRTFMMTSQVILEEANDEEKQKEDLYVSAMMLFGVAATGLLALFQIGSSFNFYKLTRNMKEVGWMPHVINILTIFSGICQCYIFLYFHRNNTKSILISVTIIGNQLSTMARYRFMIRLIRVQVQIMSEKEVTRIII